RASITIATQGATYSGASRPDWYSAKDLHALFAHVVPETASVADVVQDVFGLVRDDERQARDLGPNEIQTLLAELCQQSEPLIDIGYIGPCLELGKHYARTTGDNAIKDASVPYGIECWAICERADRGEGAADIELWINRSPSLADIVG